MCTDVEGPAARTTGGRGACLLRWRQFTVRLVARRPTQRELNYKIHFLEVNCAMLPTHFPKLALVAHRGLATHYPENTWLALEQAILAEARVIEFDIQLCMPGAYRIVVSV